MAFLPSPLDVPAVTGINPKTEKEETRNASEEMCIRDSLHRVHLVAGQSAVVHRRSKTFLNRRNELLGNITALDPVSYTHLPHAPPRHSTGYAVPYAFCAVSLRPLGPRNL